MSDSLMLAKAKAFAIRIVKLHKILRLFATYVGRHFYARVP